MATEHAPSQNSILRMTDEKTLQLIELYKQEECLWNTFLSEYKNRNLRQKATERIARKLNIKHFDGRHVVIKFKNLRNCYCQELKKIAATVNMGLSEEEVYKPRVFWFSKMDSFLRPHLQPPRSSYAALHLPNNEDRLYNDRSIGSLSNHSESSNHSHPVADNDSHQIADNVDASEVDESVHSEAEECEPARKRARNSYSRHRDDSLVQTVRDLEAKIRGLTEERKEDYYDSFGKYIASLLRSMPKEKAMLLQPQVISLIVSGPGIGEGSVSQSDEHD